MKQISLSKDGALKIIKGTKELYLKDIEDSVKSCIPGEWIFLLNNKKNQKFVAYVNPLVASNQPLIQVVKEESLSLINEKEYLFDLISKSVSRREMFLEYKDNARLVYGQADYLPGLIVDSYVNLVIIQINTSGIDRFREEIKEYFQTKYPKKKIYLLDNEKYRERELLPKFTAEQISENLVIVENKINYRVTAESLQKIGYYYDHRENRKRASELLSKFDKKFENGLDLFSYIGSWGLNLLRGGCAKMTFVDQGNFSEITTNNLILNNFESRGEFIRANVFDFLKEEVQGNKKYDLICSDPPAFCKSKKEERKAYEGYLKLHKNIFNLLDSNSLFLACSCTHYIDFAMFQKNVEEAAMHTGRKIQLIDCGVQGFDHPTTNLNNKNTYLKYFAYIVE